MLVRKVLLDKKNIFIYYKMSTPLIDPIRSSYSVPGPTADNSSRIALMKKVQVRTAFGDKKRSQLWGLNDGKNKSGSSGDSGTRTYFTAIFPRFSF
jgi:hypothetical protein